MKCRIIFWELDLKLVNSMNSFIHKKIEDLHEEFPDLFIRKQKFSDRCYSNLTIKCSDSEPIDIDFPCFGIKTEKEAMARSLSIRSLDDTSSVLSVINIGSSYYAKYHCHRLPDECIIPEAFDYDKKIIDYLEERSINVLFTNCINNYKYSKPEYMLNRAETDNRVDNSWPSPESSYLLDNLDKHKSDIDINVYKILEFLFKSPTLNTQMLGEVIYKAIFPGYWKEAVLEKNETSNKDVAEKAPNYTDVDKVNSIDEINDVCKFTQSGSTNQVDNNPPSVEDLIPKTDNMSNVRPDVDSLIYEEPKGGKKRR